MKMNSRREILRAHYVGLMKRAATWAGLVALGATTLAPMGADAAIGQLSSRKATLSDSKGNASSVTATFVFTPSSTNSGSTIKGIKFELCDSPLESVTCTSPSGADMGSATAGVQTGTDITNQYGSPAYTSTTAVTFKHATGNALTSSNAVTFPVQAIHLPTATNLEFYFRVTTYNSDTTFNGTTEKDFGGIAESTTQQLSVTANVQEDLTFCVGTAITTNCGSISGTTVTLSPNPMTTSGHSSGTAKMAASTNASGGYVITYNGTTFTDTTADTITSASSSGESVNAGGTEQFGFTLRAQASGNANGEGTNPSGGSGSATAPYDSTNSSIAYNTAGAVQVASAGGPSSQTTYTMLYVANVAGTTKPGAYTSTQTYIATAQF